MSAQAEQLLLEKQRALPPERRAEVEDFIDFPQNREADQHLVRSAARVPETQGTVMHPCSIARLEPRTHERGPTPKLQQQVERLSRPPQSKQRVAMEMLKGLLSQTARSSQ